MRPLLLYEMQFHEIHQPRSPTQKIKQILSPLIKNPYSIRKLLIAYVH